MVVKYIKGTHREVPDNVAYTYMYIHHCYKHIYTQCTTLTLVEVGSDVMYMYMPYHNSVFSSTCSCPKTSGVLMLTLQ